MALKQIQKKKPLLEIADSGDSAYASGLMPTNPNESKPIIDPNTIKLKMGPIGDKDPIVVRDKNVNVPADVFKNLKFAEAQKRSFIFDLTDLDGVFKVIKVLEVGSRKLYTVEIFGMNENKILGACQCPDYRHNEIAYCHHIAGIERLTAASEQVRTKLKFSIQNLDQFPLKVIHYNPASKKVITFGKGEIEHKTVSAIEQEKEPAEIIVDNNLLAEIERLKKEQPYKKELLEDDVELYDYQQEVFYRLIAAKRAICSLTTGAGKTLSSIACFSWILNYIDQNTKMLVIAPNSLVTQWEDEIKRVLPNVKVKLLSKSWDIHDWQDECQVGIINYQMAQRYYESLSSKKISVIIADEIQFVKNSESKTWKALKKFSFDYFFALTGTPVENGLEDFYSIMSLIEPTLLGPKWKFDYTYHNVLELKPLKIVYGGTKDMDVLKSKVENRLFSYTKLQLPPRTDHSIRVNLEVPEMRSEDNYMQMVARFASKFANRPPTFQELCILQGFLLRARQSCNADELITKEKSKHLPIKIKIFMDLISQLVEKEQRKVVVFSEWTQMINILNLHLTANNIQYTNFTGEQNLKQRKEAVKTFSTSKDCNVFIASDAGGTGLDGLQKVATAVIHIELPWNPAKLDQRSARVHRLGQKNPVDVYYLISKGTIEEAIENALFRKRSVRQALMEGTNIATQEDDKSFMSEVLAELRQRNKSE